MLIQILSGEKMSMENAVVNVALFCKQLHAFKRLENMNWRNIYWSKQSIIWDKNDKDIEEKFKSF